MKDFVVDRFFSKGNIATKLYETVVISIFWLILILPILVLFNSTGTSVLWESIYYWTHIDGRLLARFLRLSVSIGFFSILALSILLLLRNNYFETHIYPEKTTYDKDKLQARKEVLEELYLQRFDDAHFRKHTAFYVVEPEQNLPNDLVSKRFKEKGCL